MSYLRYSIIFGLIRPEISGQISLGIIYVNGEYISVRFSEEKLQMMKPFLSQRSYEALDIVLHAIKTDYPIRSVNEISYLSRYSNNLIGFSELKDIKQDATEKNKDWLFNNYIAPKQDLLLENWAFKACE